MRHVFLSLFFSFFSSLCIAQNLVPNPSFEDTVMCPFMGAQVAYAKHWNIVEETPDYFHECCVYPQFSVPQNTVSYQWAATGQAYMGLYNYSTIDTYREAIGAYLTEPLTIGQKYYVNFKANLAYNPNKGSNIATNKLGVLFSTEDFLSVSPPQNNYCQVYASQIIADTINWATIRGDFVADSAYKFISITNFFKYSDTDTMRFYNNNWYQSYYFIDDVCVSIDSMYCEIWTSLPEEILTGSNITIYPNPAQNEITLENLPYDCKQLDIYSTEGKLLITASSVSNFKTSIDVSSLAEGVYALIIRRKNSYQIKTIIKSL